MRPWREGPSVADNLSAEDRSRCMSRIRSQGMKPEMTVRSLVHRLGFRFRLHRRALPGKPDLILPRFGAVIFVHGCFWHWHRKQGCPIAGIPKSNLAYWQPKLSRTRNRDIQHTRALKRLGWRVLVIWECDLANERAVAVRIRRFLTNGPNCWPFTFAAAGTLTVVGTALAYWI